MKTVFLIEDDMLITMVMERLVKSLGYEVIGKAVGGESGLKKIQELKPDIVLTDQNLADGIKGTEVATKLRESGLNIPVVLTTGDSSSTLKEEATERGCVDCLVKPVNLGLLGKCMNKAMKELENSAVYAA